MGSQELEFLVLSKRSTGAVMNELAAGVATRAALGKGYRCLRLVRKNALAPLRVDCAHGVEVLLTGFNSPVSEPSFAHGRLVQFQVRSARLSGAVHEVANDRRGAGIPGQVDRVRLRWSGPVPALIALVHRQGGKECERQEAKSWHGRHTRKLRESGHDPIMRLRTTNNKSHAGTPEVQATPASEARPGLEQFSLPQSGSTR
jgi:hypothetical protein